MPFFIWLILSTIWGTTWLFIKVGLQDLPPFTFAGIRFLLAAIPLSILLSFRKHTIPKSASDWRLIIITGLLTFTFNYGLVFWGENYISSGLTAIFYSTFPLFGLVIANYILPTEKMTVLKTVGVMLGIAGVVIIFSNQLRLDNPFAVWGSLAIILASLGTAYAGVLVKASGKHLDPLALTVGQMLVGFPPLMITGLLVEGDPFAMQWTSTAVIALFYLAFVGSALAFVMVYWLMQRMDVTKTQLIPMASTLIAVLLGWLFLHEAFSWRILVGGFGILLGLAVTVWGHRRVRTTYMESVSAD